MAQAATISQMPKTFDEFGEYLAKLRTERRLSGQALGNAVGKSDDYIGGWERENRPINKSVLAKVGDVLGLTDIERRELFRLADLRAAPIGDRHFYSLLAANNDPIVFRALVEVDHEWAGEPKHLDAIRAVESLREAMWVIAGVGRVLATVAAAHTHILPPFSHVRWPKLLVQAERVPPSDPAAVVVDLSRWDVIPALDVAEPANPWSDAFNVASLSEGMAFKYRQAVFLDLDRARQAASLLQYWSLRTVGASCYLTLRFRHADLQDKFGATHVHWKELSDSAHRSLALWLWLNGQSAAGGAQESLAL